MPASTGFSIRAPKLVAQRHDETETVEDHFQDTRGESLDRSNTGGIISIDPSAAMAIVQDAALQELAGEAE